MDQSLEVERYPGGNGEIKPDDMWAVDIEKSSLEFNFPNDIVEWTAIQVNLSPKLERAMGENVEAMKVEFKVDRGNEEYTKLPPSGEIEYWQVPLNEKMRLPTDVFVRKIQITLFFPPDFEVESEMPELQIEIFGCTERK